MLLVGSVIAHCWGENGVKERAPASWYPLSEGKAPGPTPKWSREFSTLDGSQGCRAGSAWWIDAREGGSKPLGMLSRRIPLLVVPPQP